MRRGRNSDAVDKRRFPIGSLPSETCFGRRLDRRPYDRSKQMPRAAKATSFRTRPNKVVGHPRLAIALTVAVLVALGVLTELAIEGGHATEWLAALQTFSSLILIAITGLYVFLTYRMLQVQQRPIDALRLQREIAAVQELSEQLLKFGLVIDDPLRAISTCNWRSSGSG